MIVIMLCLLDGFSCLFVKYIILKTELLNNFRKKLFLKLNVLGFGRVCFGLSTKLCLLPY